MAALAIFLWQNGASPAALTRAVRAFGPLRADEEICLLPDAGGAGTSQKIWDDVAYADGVLPRVRQLATLPTLCPTAALNRALAATEAPWCLFWAASLVATPTTLPSLRRQIEAAQRRATGTVPAWPALLVGVTDHRAAAEPSPLAHFLATREGRGSAPWREGDDVPADAVPPDGWAAPRALLTTLGGFDEAFGAEVAAVDLARRAYVAGVTLRLCRDVQARRAQATTVAQAVLRWRELGHDTLTLLRKHADPHAMDRLVQRLGPYRALRQDAAALAAQLDAVDRRLVAGRRPHPAHIAGLQPSLANLYAVSVLEGVLRHPAGAGLWPTTGEGRTTQAAPPGSKVRAHRSGRTPAARRRPKGPHA